MYPNSAEHRRNLEKFMQLKEHRSRYSVTSYRSSSDLPSKKNHLSSAEAQKFLKKVERPANTDMGRTSKPLVVDRRMSKLEEEHKRRQENKRKYSTTAYKQSMSKKTTVESKPTAPQSTLDMNMMEPMSAPASSTTPLSTYRCPTPADDKLESAFQIIKNNLNAYSIPMPKLAMADIAPTPETSTQTPEPQKSPLAELEAIYHDLQIKGQIKEKEDKEDKEEPQMYTDKPEEEHPGVDKTTLSFLDARRVEVFFGHLANKLVAPIVIIGGLILSSLDHSVVAEYAAGFFEDVLDFITTVEEFDPLE